EAKYPHGWVQACGLSWGTDANARDLAIAVFWRRCGSSRALAGIGDAPDRTAGIVGDEQRTILGDGKRSRASPDFSALLARYPEAGDEVLVVVLRPAVLERHAHHFVAGGLRAIPGPLERNEGAPFVLRREMLAF